jgi:hypothetical protein
VTLLPLLAAALGTIVPCVALWLTDQARAAR